MLVVDRCRFNMILDSLQTIIIIRLDHGTERGWNDGYHNDDVVLQRAFAGDRLGVFDALIVERRSRRLVKTRPIDDPIPVQEVTASFIHQSWKNRRIQEQESIIRFAISPLIR